MMPKGAVLPNRGPNINTYPRQEVSGSRDLRNIWQKIRAYHKPTSRILGYPLPGTSTSWEEGTPTQANILEQTDGWWLCLVKHKQFSSSSLHPNHVITLTD